MELHRIIYDLLAAQIKFGTYRYKDPLPRMEDASRWFCVSLDTVRAAYLLLKKEGYITITKKAGANVAVQFEEAEMEKHIQIYFALRRDATLDLCRSLGPLFSHIQWFALKNAGPERLNELERLSVQPEALMPYDMVKHVELIYGTLNNDLLMRLVWQAFFFYQAPFLSLPENLAAFEKGDDALLNMIGFCRRKDWDGLWKIVSIYQDQLTAGITSFYANRITLEPPGDPVSFHWNDYQNTSQRCYSLAIDLLKGIRLGFFAQDGFLPSPSKIAEEYQVSIITVRRTLVLLNQLGATRSVNGVGTKVLPTEESADNCDFTQPVIRKRLLDFVESLQILTLTCRACTESTFAIMDAATADLWKNRLAAVKERRQYESVLFESLEVVSQFSPIRAVREIYRQLLQILMWGYPLRSLRNRNGSREEIKQFYLPHVRILLESLDQRDGAGLGAELEHLLLYEFKYAVAQLNELDITEANNLLIP